MRIKTKSIESITKKTEIYQDIKKLLDINMKNNKSELNQENKINLQEQTLNQLYNLLKETNQKDTNLKDFKDLILIKHEKKELLTNSDIYYLMKTILNIEYETLKMKSERTLKENHKIKEYYINKEVKEIQNKRGYKQILSDIEEAHKNGQKGLIKEYYESFKTTLKNKFENNSDYIFILNKLTTDLRINVVNLEVKSQEIEASQSVEIKEKVKDIVKDIDTGPKLGK